MAVSVFQRSSRPAFRGDNVTFEHRRREIDGQKRETPVFSALRDPKPDKSGSGDTTGWPRKRSPCPFPVIGRSGSRLLGVLPRFLINVPPGAILLAVSDSLSLSMGRCGGIWLSAEFGGSRSPSVFTGIPTKFHQRTSNRPALSQSSQDGSGIRFLASSEQSLKSPRNRSRAPV